MRPISTMFLILFVLCCSSAAEENVIKGDSTSLENLKAQIHPHASLSLSCDYQRLLHLARHAKPSSVWWSADTTDQRAYITKHVGLMNRINSDEAPLFPLLKSAKGFLFAGYTSHLATGMPDTVLIADVGDSAEDLRSWITKLFTRNERGIEARARQFKGFTQRHRRDSFFAGMHNELFLYGYAKRCENNFGLGSNSATSNAAICMDISLKQILREMALLTKNKRDTYGFGKWGEMTRGIEPQLRIEIDFTEKTAAKKTAPELQHDTQTHEWRSTFTLKQFGSYEFKSVSERIRNCVPTGSQIWSLLHLDTERISSRFISALSEQELRTFNALLGFSLQQLPSVLSGDVMLAGRAGFGLPEAILALQVSDPAALEQALDNIIKEIPGGHRIKAEGARGAWTIKLPTSLPQVLAIGLSDDLLVLCNNQFHLPQFLSTNDKHDTSTVRDESFFLSIDLPQLAKTFLPLAWAFLSSSEEALSTAIVQRLYWPLNDALMETIQAEDRAGAINDLLSDWQRQSLAIVFPDQDIGKCCATSFGLWAEALDGNPVIICRSKIGYHRISHKDNTMTREQVDKLVKNNTHRAGPQLDDLPILDIPETPYFNKHWLPSVKTMTQHLPRYEARMSGGQIGAAHLHEHGAPLLAICSGIFLSALWVDVNQLKSRILHRRARQAAQE